MSHAAPPQTHRAGNELRCYMHPHCKTGSTCEYSNMPYIVVDVPSEEAIVASGKLTETIQAKLKFLPGVRTYKHHLCGAGIKWRLLATYLTFGGSMERSHEELASGTASVVVCDKS